MRPCQGPSHDNPSQIRGEFMRAVRILAQRPDRAVVALSELCEERKGEELMSAPSYSKPPTLPPQTPYTVGNQPLRPKLEERFSPPAQFFEPGQHSKILQPVATRSPPEHMAPKRGKWTSPPPPEAPPADHKLFENQLGMGLQLATSSTEAREKDSASETSSEVFTDEGSDVPDDDIHSVKSYTEGSSPIHTGPLRRPSWHTPHETIRVPNHSVLANSASPSSSSSARRFARTPDKVEHIPPASQADEHARRASSSCLPPHPTKHHSHSLPPNSPKHANPSPSPTLSLNTRFPFPAIDPANVYYQATPLATALRAVRHVQPSSLAYSRQLSSAPGCSSDSGSHSPVSVAGHFRQTQDRTFERNHSDMGNIKAPVPRDIFPVNLPPSLSGLNFRSGGEPRTFSFGSSDTPTPATFHKDQQRRHPHGGSSGSSHSRSNSIKGTTRVSSRGGSPQLSISIENASHQKRGNSVSPQKHTSNHSYRESADVHNPSTASIPLESGQLDANHVAREIEPSQSPHVAALADPSLAPLAASRAAASSGSSPARSPTGRQSTGVSRSRSPSPSSASPPLTAMAQTFRIEGEKRTMDMGSGEDEVGDEEYGPIRLKASDSVSTIKAERRVSSQSRNSNQR